MQQETDSATALPSMLAGVQWLAPPAPADSAASASRAVEAEPACQAGPPRDLLGDVLAWIEDDDVPVEEWTEEEVVYLHWKMLAMVRTLANPGGALDEKIDILHWVFAEPAKDALPFSFASCVQVVANSPHAHIPYCGKTDVEEIRHWIALQLKAWFGNSLAQFPLWVRQAIIENPGWVARQLEKNPQWINQQLRKQRDQGDLFN